MQCFRLICFTAESWCNKLSIIYSSSVTHWSWEDFPPARSFLSDILMDFLDGLQLVACLVSRNNLEDLLSSINYSVETCVIPGPWAKSLGVQKQHKRPKCFTSPKQILLNSLMKGTPRQQQFLRTFFFSPKTVRCCFLRTAALHGSPAAGIKHLMST